MRREHWSILLATLIGLPAIWGRFSLDLQHVAPAEGIALYGLAIVGAAFLLTWGAELAEMEMSPNLALVVLALVAVLPEYAVDMYYSWSAGTFRAAPGVVNANQAYALANMTGANRVLIGLGWPVIALIAWQRNQRTAIRLELARSVDIFFLFIATLYSIAIPLKGTITVVDTVFFLSLYGVYLFISSKVPSRDTHMVGPAAMIAEWARGPRVAMTWGFFLVSVTVITCASEPFAVSLVETGKRFGIDEFLLVQWLAPFASESPEFLAVILLTLKGAATDGLGALVSSKVNQWSLLVGMVPLAFALGHLHTGQGWQGGFALDGRQSEELILTSTQSFYAITAILSYRFRLADALGLMVLFLVQLWGTMGLEETGRHALITPWHYSLSAIYVALGVVRLIHHRRFLPAVMRGALWLDSSSYEAVVGGVEHEAEVLTLAAEGPEASPDKEAEVRGEWSGR